MTEKLSKKSTASALFDYAVLPFSAQEADVVCRVIKRLASGSGKADERTLSRYWAMVLVSARRAEAALAVSEPWRPIEDNEMRERMRNEDFSAIQNKALRARLRKLSPERSRVGEQLQRLLSREPSTLPRDLEILIAVTQGAIELGFVSDHPQHQRIEAYLSRTSGLTKDQVVRSIKKSLVSPWVTGDRKGGRPNATGLDNYVAALLRIYKRLAGKEPAISRDRRSGKPTGPLIAFLRAALEPKVFRPFARHPHSLESLASIVERVKKRSAASSGRL